MRSRREEQARHEEQARGAGGAQRRRIQFSAALLCTMRNDVFRV